jgi:hypothetical protein
MVAVSSGMPARWPRGHRVEAHRLALVSGRTRAWLKTKNRILSGFTAPIEVGATALKGQFQLWVLQSGDRNSVAKPHFPASWRPVVEC